MNLGAPIYHYTSIIGLNGIINSRSVWASDCRYLNDRKELVHAINLFISRIEKRFNEALSLALDWYSYSQAHCVFSLSRSPRVLSQWRSYGDDGRGAAIGFYPKYLPGIGKSALLVECIYHDHDSFIDEVYEASKKDIEALQQMFFDSDGAINLFWKRIEDNPLPLAKLYAELLRVKNEAFQEEQEVRLVLSVPSAKVKTRVAEGLIVPYVEHPIIDESDAGYLWTRVPEIWFGPRCDKRNMDAIQVFEQFGWGSKGIHHFDCGYI